MGLLRLDNSTIREKPEIWDEPLVMPLIFVRKRETKCARFAIDRMHRKGPRSLRCNHELSSSLAFETMFKLSREDIPDHPQEFVDSIRDMFGACSLQIERLIILEMIAQAMHKLAGSHCFKGKSEPYCFDASNRCSI
jgi:hypothetical protein